MSKAVFCFRQLVDLHQQGRDFCSRISTMTNPSLCSTEKVMLAPFAFHCIFLFSTETNFSRDLKFIVKRSYSLLTLRFGRKFNFCS